MGVSFGLGGRGGGSGEEGSGGGCLGGCLDGNGVCWGGLGFGIYGLFD